MNNLDACLSDKILLHIGYHKTATTWFQSELFAQPELGFQLLSNRNLVHKAFCQPNPFCDEPNQYIQQVVSEAGAATNAGKTFVLSHERLSGYPSSGGFDSRQIADRLKLHFPNARVLCLFREQKAMILSAWRQQIVDGGGASLRRFLSPPEPTIVRIPLFDPNMYKYTYLLTYYSKLFGSSNVLFVPYEEFGIRPQDVVTKLGRLIGHEKLGQDALRLVTQMEKPNPSLSPLILGAHRMLNVLFSRTQLSQNCVVDLGARNIRTVMRFTDKYLRKVIPASVVKYFQERASEKVDHYCGTMFHDDNALLSKLVGQQLSAYGYSMDSKTGSGNGN